ncbi:MAG TPA: hypothetical protein VHP31_01720 [Caproicibacter sp.]|nr:hypothetical protein [Caproicibacter sp.]
MDTVNRIILIAALSLLAIAIVVGVFQYVNFYRHDHFVCPNCGNKFKPKVLRMIFSENAGGGKIIKCPKCGKKDYMEAQKDE